MVERHALGERDEGRLHRQGAPSRVKRQAAGQQQSLPHVLRREQGRAAFQSQQRRARSRDAQRHKPKDLHVAQRDFALFVAQIVEDGVGFVENHKREAVGGGLKAAGGNGQPIWFGSSSGQSAW